jgi:acetate kinase
MRVLVVNTGSSSLKLRVLDEADTVVARTDLGPIAEVGGHELGDALASLGEFGAVGHRIVHGGPDFRAPVLVDADVRRRLEATVDLAPLHQPAGLAGLDRLAELAPDVPVVACFDTAFHARLPPAASTYAVPANWRDNLGVRRYGFHGLSHAHVARRVAELAGWPAAGDPPRIVSCHLGAGASLAAVLGDHSVDTTMGFTPLEGLVMATRAGTFDPGAVLWLQTHAGLSADEVSEALEHRSGWWALAGTRDMSEVVRRAATGEVAAGLALAVTGHRLRALLAAMVAALGGLDLLAFTGGVGERAHAVRAAAVEGMGFLGIAVDAALDAVAVPDCEVTAPGAAVRTFVIAAREDVEVARGVRQVLADV